jgi:hypothetical protein
VAWVRGAKRVSPTVGLQAISSTNCRFTVMATVASGIGGSQATLPCLRSVPGCPGPRHRNHLVGRANLHRPGMAWSVMPSSIVSTHGAQPYWWFLRTSVDHTSLGLPHAARPEYTCRC